MRYLLPLLVLTLSACTTELVQVDVLKCSDDGWWDERFELRRKITVDAASALPSGYQVRVPLMDHLASVDADPNQLRVVTRRPDETCEELARHVDAVAGELWFRLPDGDPHRVVWLYDDAADPPSAPADPRAVFELYADELHPATDLGWDLVDAETPLEVGTGSTADLQSATTQDEIAEGTITEMSVSIRLGAEGVGFIGFVEGIHLSGVIFYPHESLMVQLGPFQSENPAWDPAPLATLGASTELVSADVTLVRGGDEVSVAARGSHFETLPIAVAGAVPLQFAFSNGSSPDPATKLVQERLRVRRLAAPEPGVSLGPVEPR